jgi:hypothetical protein
MDELKPAKTGIGTLLRRAVQPVAAPTDSPLAGEYPKDNQGGQDQSRKPAQGVIYDVDGSTRPTEPTAPGLDAVS